MQSFRSPKNKMIVVGISLIMLMSGLSLVAGVFESPAPAAHANTVQPSASSSGYYYLNFTESGLPNGTYWYMYVGYSGYPYYYYNSTTYSTNSFSLPNNTYIFGDIHYSSSYTYSITPSQGTVNINGNNVSVHINFINTSSSTPVVTYNHYFNITNFPSVISGTQWYWTVTLQGVNVSYGPYTPTGYSDSILFSGLYPGEYSYTISSVAGTSLTPNSGTFTVSSNATTSIKFNHLYEVSFEETGLQASQSFTVYFGGMYNTSLPSYNYLNFMVANGTYNYEITSYPSDYSPTPSIGTVNVNGGSVVVNINFETTPSTYNFTFNLINLPSNVPDSSWSFGVKLYLNGTYLGYQSGVTTVSYSSLGNGTYFFIIYPGNFGNPPIASGISPNSGIRVINGSSVTVNLTLLPPVETYYANYTITSFPENIGQIIEWQVEVVNGTGVGNILNSFSNKISFSGLPSGSYTYYISGYPYFTVKNPKGTFKIANSSVDFSVSITMAKMYAVSFQQTGLNPGSDWGVVVDNGFTYNNSYSGSSLLTVLSTFPYAGQLPNGTYYVQGFVEYNGHYYFTSPQKIVVSGKSVNATVAFSPTGSSSTGLLGISPYVIYGVIAFAGIVVGAGIVYAALRRKLRGPKT